MHSLFFFLRDLLSSRAMTFRMWSVAWDRWLLVYSIENFVVVKLSLSWVVRWFTRWWGQVLGSLIIEKMSACNTIALFFVLTNILHFLLELFSNRYLSWEAEDFRSQFAFEVAIVRSFSSRFLGKTSWIWESHIGHLIYRKREILSFQVLWHTVF
jgi:hypothetical protein